MSHNKTAYLVLHVNTITLNVVRAGIYSDSAENLTMDFKRGFAVDVHSETRNNFEEAIKAMHEYIDDSLVHQWIKPLLNGEKS